MVLKVELECMRREEGGVGQFKERKLSCADRHPFVTVDSLIEDADSEHVGRDLLWRWMNPPPPKLEGQESEEAFEELAQPRRCLRSWKAEESR